MPKPSPKLPPQPRPTEIRRLEELVFQNTELIQRIGVQQDEIKQQLSNIQALLLSKNASTKTWEWWE